MRYLTLGEVLELHRLIIARWGGVAGVRDLGALESAVAQPRMSFGGSDLYSDIVEKAAALCFSLVQNHPFVDGNKRVAHASMETFLLLNGCEIHASVDEQEQVMLAVASGALSRDGLTGWLRDHAVER
jgi:death-on-curing protein